MSTLECIHIHTGYPQLHRSCANRHGGRRRSDAEERGVIPRILPDTQLELFPGAILYVSQADAAQALGISTRMIQYWETQGLLHPEQPQEGRSRRYTSRDLVEMAFIKAMVVDQGYTVPALKEKLEGLPAPYYYDAQDLFWDMRSRAWKSRTMLASEQVAQQGERLVPALAALLERLSGTDPERMATGVLGLVRDGLAGKLPEPRRRGAGKPAARRRPRPAPILDQ